MEEMSYVFSFNFFFTARSFSPCIGGHWHFPFGHRRHKIFMLFFQQKKCLLRFLSLALDLCRPFSPWASLARRLLSLLLCLSPALYSKFVATREKKTCALRCDRKKKDNKRNAGDLKKTELKKNSVPFLIYFNWSLSVKAVNDDSYRNESERKLFTMTLHDYDVKRPNFTFYGVPERKTTIFICFSKLWQGPLEFNPKKELRQHLANWTRWNKGDLGIKFETHRECNF